MKKFKTIVFHDILQHVIYAPCCYSVISLFLGETHSKFKHMSEKENTAALRDDSCNIV